MNFAAAVSKLHRKEFSWERVAPGYATREQVAAQLGCAPENVRSKLAVGLRLGHFEAKTFKIWDAATERFVFKEGYRILNGSAPAAAPSAPKPVPAVGAKVISRNGQTGKITAMRGQQLTVTWSSGQITKPTTAAIKKQNLRLA